MDYYVIVMIIFYYINIYDIYVQDGDTALMCACIEDKVDAVKVLLQAGANMEIQDNVRNSIM